MDRLRARRPAPPARSSPPSGSCRPARGGPMHTVRSARRAGNASRSASDAASTVSMPRLRQVRMMRTAISPRLAIRMRRILMPGPRADPQQHLPVFHQRAVARQDLGDRAAHAGAHRVHELHHLDDADDGVLLHDRAHLDKGRGPGLGRAIERAQQRRRDILRAPPGCRRGRRWRGGAAGAGGPQVAGAAPWRGPRRRGAGCRAAA